MKKILPNLLLGVVILLMLTGCLWCWEGRCWPNSISGDGCKKAKCTFMEGSRKSDNKQVEEDPDNPELIDKDESLHKED